MNERGEIYTKDKDGNIIIIEIDQFGRKWTKDQFGVRVLLPDQAPLAFTVHEDLDK